MGVNIRKNYILNIRHLSEHGRKAVVALNGVEITQRFIQSCPADKKFDNNLANATNVFLKCISKGELPVSSSWGAFTFQVPNREGSETSSGKEAGKEHGYVRHFSVVADPPWKDGFCNKRMSDTKVKGWE